MRTLLVSAGLLLLLSVAFITPHPLQRLQRHEILDLAQKCETSCSQGSWVEDVSELKVNSSCGDEFFCKVQEVLTQELGNSSALVRNLDQFNSGRNVSCEEKLEGLERIRSQVKLPELMRSIVHCVRMKNWKTPGDH